MTDPGFPSAEQRDPGRLGRTRSEARALIGAIVVSVLAHACILFGTAADGGYARSGANAGVPLLNLAFVPSLPNATVQPAPHLTRSSDAPPSPRADRIVAAAVSATRAHAAHDQVAETPFTVPSRADPRDINHGNPGAQVTALQPPSVATGPAAKSSNSHPDRLSIATADQYRVALVLQARREREPLALAAEGRTRVRLSFASGGALESANVVASSGDDTLDAEALRLFERARTMLPVPEALLAKQFSIEATVSFERN
jgi:TonB family protein